LVNCESGYSDETVDYLKPMVATCTNFIVATRVQRERERLQKQIAESEALVHDLLDRIPAGLVFETLGRDVAFVNETLLSMFKLPVTSDQMIGISGRESSEKIGSLLKNPDGYIDRVHELINEGCPTNADVLELVDGRRFERDFVVINSNGIPTGYMWCYRDVTRTSFTRRTDASELSSRATVH